MQVRSWRHARTRRAVAGLTSIAVVATVAAVGGTTPVGAATPTAVYAFHDLGVSFNPQAVNASHEVAGSIQTGPNTYAAAVWQNGTLSRLPGSGASAIGVTDAGRIIGVANDDHPLFWANPTASPTVGGFAGQVYTADEVSGYSSWADSTTNQGVILDATGRTVLRMPAYYLPLGLSKDTFVQRWADFATNRYHWYLASTTTGTKLADLPNYSSTMGSDGSTQSAIPGATRVRLPDGTSVDRPIAAASDINARHDLLALNSVLPAGADTPIDLNTLVPSGWRFADSSGLGDDGDIVGRCYAPDNSLHGCLLQAAPEAPTLSSSLTFRDGTGALLSAVSPEVGDTVHVRLTVAAATNAPGTIHGIGFTGGPLVISPASAVELTGPSPAIPADLSLVSGQSVSYDFTLKIKALGVIHLYSTPYGTDDSGGAAKVIAGQASFSTSSLKVAVSASPKQVALTVDPATGKTIAKKITVTVAVTNGATTPINHVTAPKTLTVAYSDPSAVAVPKVALVADTGPLQAGQGNAPKPDLGTIAPGKTKKVTYTLSAEGDGDYQVSALVTGEGSTGARLAGTGSSRVLIGAPDLVVTTSFGRGVRSPSYPGLLVAGTAFTIDVTLENRSYIHTIGIAPIYGDLAGNAIDGHTEALNTPIQLASSAKIVASAAYQLAPRTSKKLQLVVHTTSVQAATMVADKQVGGGTRAIVDIPDIEAYDLVKAADGTLTKGPRLTGSAEFVNGPQRFTVSLDDSDARPDPEPSTLVGTAWYLSKGALLTLNDLTVGVVCALVKDLPTMVLHGIENVPTALIGLMTDQVELYESIKDNPEELANFINEIDNTALAAYNHAPALLGKVSEFTAALNKSVLDSYTKMSNDYYHGDYNTALVDMSHEFTSQVANAGLLLAPGILARSPRALAAFRAAKASVYATVAEELAPLTARVVSAAEATKALATLLKPGFQMSNQVLRSLFGLSESQAAFLRQFAADNDLLIVVRSRATESLEWLNRGAVLKPEAIKIKNVSWLDAKYLGFRSRDVGRVVIRKILPTVEDVETALRANGFAPADAEWSEALTRLAQRNEELTKTGDGYVRQLQDVADAGKGQDLKWNFADNAVDPNAYTDTVTNYGFQIVDDGGGNFVPQYKVNGRWRSVTGDVDFLQISKANGAPLSDVERVAVYQRLSKSPVGFMHPESATWNNAKLGAFDFAAKRNEFVRAGYVAQFGPDSVTRAVKFVDEASTFTSPSNYRIIWDGGYQNPLGATTNVQPVSQVGSLSSTTVAAGDTVSVSASGFAPGENVAIVVHSTPVHLATVTADAHGTVRTTVAIPAGLPAGSHYLELTGLDSGHTLDLPFTVVDRLAYTGADAFGTTLLAAVIALLVGLSLSWVGRPQKVVSTRASKCRLR